MLRCPTCVSIVADHGAKRCAVCGESFKRRPPTVLGADRRTKNQVTSWDLRATAEANRADALDLIDLPAEHRRDISGRVAARRRD